MARLRNALLAGLVFAFLLREGSPPVLAQSSSAGSPHIGFEVRAGVDPIHANGEPDIGIDPFGKGLVSGATGTGTQRSVWLGSVDGGHTFRIITPGPPPSAIAGIIDPPGGGDTDINFDRSGKQYFADLYALACLRTATTTDGGATVSQEIYPAGCSGIPGADRQWLAVYDPAPGTPNQSAYTGPKPLIYLEYNNVVSGAQWNKSNSAVDLVPGGPGLTYMAATNGTTSPCVANGSFYAPFGADGYPAIDQVTGKVLQASGSQNSDGTFSLLLNIGTPDASGDLTFLDFPSVANPCGDSSKLIHIADNLSGSPSTLFTVLSMDSARNLFITWALSPNSGSPALRQVFVSASSAASGWTNWSTPVQMSDGSTVTGDAVNVFPWIKAGWARRAGRGSYGADPGAETPQPARPSLEAFFSPGLYSTDLAGGGRSGGPNLYLRKNSPPPPQFKHNCPSRIGV